MGRLAGEDLELAINVGVAVETYEKGLREQASSPGWELLPLPAVQHDDVLRRIHEGGPPANGEGKGYQDILIWETVRAQLQSDAHVVFVSSDGDFRGPDGELAAGLAAEAAATAPNTRLELIRTLKEFVDEHLAPRRVEEFWMSLDKAGKYELEHAVAEELLGMWLDPDTRHAAVPGKQLAWISGVLDTSDVELHDARMLSDGQIAFEMLVDVRVMIEAALSPDDSVSEPIDTHLDVTSEGRWDPNARRPTHMEVLGISFSG